MPLLPLSEEPPCCGKRLVVGLLPEIVVLPFTSVRLRVETVPPLKVSIDGEVLARTPFTARIAPRAISVLAPAR